MTPSADKPHSVKWEGLTPPYRTIVVDPPWRIDYNGRVGKSRRGDRGLPYSLLSVDEIAALPVSDLAARDSVVWLWVVPSLHRRGFGVQVIESWGFRVTAEIVWAKPTFGMGHVVRHCHELLLVGARGRGRLTGRSDVRSVQAWRGATGWVGYRGHSVKPAGALDLVERTSPPPYVELFARQPRLGWDHWGYGYEVSA